MSLIIRRVRSADILMLALDRRSVRNYDFDGRLHIAKANISKANVCPYVGKEIPDYDKLRLDPNRIYYLYRDPKELEKAAATFNGLELLSEHQPVTSEERKPELVIGATGTDASYEHPFLRNSLVIWPSDDIKDVETDVKRQISCGYRYTADMTPGTTPEGEKYDGVMRDIVGNHVALVKEGRAGADVVIGDSKPNKGKAPMATMTRRAARTIRYLAPYIKSKLAQDESVDLRKLLTPVTAANWESDKQRILRGVMKLTAGKLAQDASIGEVAELLDMIEAHGVDKGEDESVSKAQHNAMEAAAHGTSNIGIPKKVGEEFAEKDKGKKFDSKKKAADNDEEKDKDMKEGGGAHGAIHDLLKGKVDGDTMDKVHQILAKHGGGGGATDEDKEGDEPKDSDLDHEQDEEEDKESEEFDGGEDEEESEFKSEEDKDKELGATDDGETEAEHKEDEEEWRRGSMSKAATDRKKAKDEPPSFKGRPRPGGGMDRKPGMDGKVTRGAMDAAIGKAVARERANQQAIRNAERFVTPWVGELPATMSFDSAGAVYAAALKACGIKNVDRIHPSAYRAMLENLPKPSERRAVEGRRLRGEMAADSKAVASIHEMFPDTPRIRRIG